ncbi:cytochrome P450 71A1-like [Gossypium hirsutum]|uniref:Cytochrome P450 71A1-like n=1 Tax=Gossypium hirsutum TaxID=3635 RepID=A0ABM3C3X2_GOSHI|nr:cytochrome P450 71A1-like [Gossypium hirsutum]
MVKNYDTVFMNKPNTTAANILFYGCKDLGFSPYGDYWRQVRKLCALELLSARSVQTFQFVREEEVDAIIRKIHEAAVNGDVVDLTKMLMASRVIDEHKEKEAIDEKKDFISIILQLQKDGLDLTQGNIKAIILDMFAGGTETTSTTAEWAMSELLKKSDVLKKVEQDVRKVAKNKQKIDLNDLNETKYLKFFINVWAIQRDPTWWENPEEFIPERFENSRVHFKGQDFQFIPFGCGRRDCPGMPFAIASLEYLVANLLFRFDWKLGDGETTETLDLIENYGLTVNKKVPLRVMPTIFHPST